MIGTPLSEFRCILLQKRDIDVYQASNEIKHFRSELHGIRGDIEKYCTD